MPYATKTAQRAHEARRAKDPDRRRAKVEYERQRRERWKAAGVYTLMRRAEGYKTKLRSYDLTIEQYQAAVDSRAGRCDICGEPGMPLCVEHDHVTLAKRGLTCDRCNQLLSRAKDRPDVLRRAADYLESPPGLASVSSADLRSVGAAL